MKQAKNHAGFLRRNRHFLYILPWLLGLLLFRAIPMIGSLVCGFTDFHLFRGIRHTGLMNYTQIIQNSEVLRSIGLTVKFACISVPLRLCAAMLAALLLNRAVRGIRTFRTLYYLPSILGGSVAAAVLWKAMFRDGGTVNAILTVLHLPAVTWLADAHASLWVIILLRVWEFGAPMLMLNPEIVKAEKPFETEEGCLSVKGVHKTVRYETIRVRYQNDKMQFRQKAYSGWTAQIIQHEIDHCNGILI